jgi:hypothetical protein
MTKHSERDPKTGRFVSKIANDATPERALTPPPSMLPTRRKSDGSKSRLTFVESPIDWMDRALSGTPVAYETPIKKMH